MWMLFCCCFWACTCYKYDKFIFFSPKSHTLNYYSHILMMFCIVLNEGQTCEIIRYYWLNSSYFVCIIHLKRIQLLKKNIHLHKKMFCSEQTKACRCPNIERCCWIHSFISWKKNIFLYSLMLKGWTQKAIFYLLYFPSFSLDLLFLCFIYVYKYLVMFSVELITHLARTPYLAICRMHL